MIAIHIVCTHDGVELAETLTRLLEAEEHQVRVSFGRQSLRALDGVKDCDDAVILIWSADAPASHYMLEWARQIPQHRLIEVARAAGWPKSARKAPVLDFTAWRGVRGARVWNALNDRLRVLTRALEPQRPPPRHAALALGAAGLAAVIGAVVVRVNMPDAPLIDPESNEQTLIAYDDPSTGIGGPLRAIEPGSIDDLAPISPIATTSFALIEYDAAPPNLAPLPDYEEVVIRDPTMLERVSALNPLRRETGED